MLRQLINSSGGKGRQGFSKTRLIQLDDIPATYGTPGQYLIIKADQSGFEYADHAPISRGTNIFNADGIEDAVNIMVWRAPYACILSAFYAQRTGGTGAAVNARKNGSTALLSSDLSLTATDWTDSADLQNEEFSIGDYLEAQLISAADGPTQIIIQLDFQRTFS
jgi:hypothetical protein